MVAKMTDILLQIPCEIQWCKNFENQTTFGKVMNEKCRWSFFTHTLYTRYSLGDEIPERDIFLNLRRHRTRTKTSILNVKFLD